MFELQRVIFTRKDAANCPISEAYCKVASVLGSIV